MRQTAVVSSLGHPASNLPPLAYLVAAGLFVFAAMPSTPAMAEKTPKAKILDVEKAPAAAAKPETAPKADGMEAQAQMTPAEPAAADQPAPSAPSAAPAEQVQAPAMPMATPPMNENKASAAAPHSPTAVAATPAPAAARTGGDSGRDAEGRLIAKVHPLQAARPDRNIVICEGGCDGTRIVYDGPTAVAGGDVSVGGAEFNATCKGGCYANASGHTWTGSDPDRASGTSTLVTAPRLLDGDGNWLTNATPGIISAPPVATAQSSAEPPKSQAKQSKPKRDDFLSRINREREAERAAKAAAQ